MSCSRCGDYFHNARRCALPSDATEEAKERAHKEASARWDAAWRAARAKYGTTTRELVVEELRRMFPPQTRTERAAAARRSSPPAVTAEPELVEIASPRRTVVVIDGGDCAKGFSRAFDAATRGDADKWHVVAADGLAAGVRTAIALQADHVVLCVGVDLDKSTLKPWVQRLRGIHGLQVIAVYDSYAKIDEIDDEVASIGADGWMTVDRVKDSLESTIARWQPREKWIKPPQPWTAPMLGKSN